MNMPEYKHKLVGGPSRDIIHKGRGKIQLITVQTHGKLYYYEYAYTAAGGVRKMLYNPERTKTI